MISLKLLQILLLPCSWLYGLFINVRNFLYDKKLFKVYSVSIPVVSVGNLVAGGTGKTPFVEFLIRYYENLGKRVAVLSRGYKRQSTGQRIIFAGQEDRGNFQLLGDEPYQIARKFPNVTLIVDADRVRGANSIKKSEVDIILLDDGFQHRSLARNLDILLVDSQSNLQKIPLIPAGLRREPMKSIRRANIIAINGDQKHINNFQIKRLYSNVPIMQFQYHPVAFHSVFEKTSISISSVKGKSCIGFCGIGSPLRFRTMLSNLQINIREFFTFRDHHLFTSSDFEKIASAFDKCSTEYIFTTEKDAVRISADIIPDRIIKLIYYLEIKIEISEGEKELERLLKSTLNNCFV